MQTTLNKIRSHRPCVSGWKKILTYLNKTEADDEPLSISTILKSNGIDDALWALRAVDGYDKEIKLFAVWCARQVQHLMKDQRSINSLDVAEKYLACSAVLEEVKMAAADAADAADAATYAAATYAAAAYAADAAADAAANAAANATYDAATYAADAAAYAAYAANAANAADAAANAAYAAADAYDANAAANATYDAATYAADAAYAAYAAYDAYDAAATYAAATYAAAAKQQMIEKQTEKLLEICSSFEVTV